jgi:dephospho-CoA kinase
MKVIGITGGIGSGKTMICSVFKTLGIPVFNADVVAKELYDERPELVIQIQNHFGSDLVFDGKLNKQKLAELVFSDNKKLQILNSLVHPLVGEAFQTWQKKQRALYIIREAAIMIESKSYLDCDHLILVSAPAQLKVKRVITRSQLTEAQILARIQEQMTDEERRPFCDFEIINDEVDFILPQIFTLHRQFMA